MGAKRFSLILALTLSCYVWPDISNAQLTILHSFRDGSVPNDGGLPSRGLIQAPDGNFYGTTPASSNQHFNGTVYRLTLGGSVEIVHSFTKKERSSPGTSLLYYNGKLIGGIEREQRDGSVPSDGQFPADRLVVGSDNNLYGVTEAGGSADRGTIFRISP
jgi:uncharacterized repeat protein (TIGR03803 family)